MRIAHVTLDGNLPRYGIGLAVVRLAEALARRGHDVSLLCRERNAREVGTLVGVSVLPLRRSGGILGGRLGYIRQVRRALAGGVDVVHVHGLTRIARWLRGAWARRGARLVVTAHAADELGPSASASGDATARRARRHEKHVREVLARADAVVAPSRWMAGRVEAAGGRRVDVVGLGPTDETPVASEAHDGFVVASLARLVSVKGADLLLEAFARAFSAEPSARLVLAGDGPLRDALERRVRELGLGGRVELPGYVTADARRRLLGRTDVVAVPTRGDYETFGLAALDGSAAGIPLVVSDGGALPERVEHGEGCVVPSGDVERLAQTLVDLRSDASRRREMGVRGRETAERSSWDAVATAYEAVYRRAAQRAEE